MTAVELMDKMISQLPKAFTPKDMVFILSNKNYEMLCTELKRKVRTYKKYTVKTHVLCPKENQYFLHKKDFKI